MKNKKIINKVVVYQTKGGAIELKSDIQKDTVWASQIQIAKVFGVERSVITKHIRNILNSVELDSNSVCAKFAHTAKDNKIYQVQYYNLDVILSVGYRINSLKAIHFRKWATKTLRDHITKGFTINRKVLKKNYVEFQKVIDNMKHLLPSDVNIDNSEVLELISIFANTWFSLEAYDKDKLIIKGFAKKVI